MTDDRRSLSPADVVGLKEIADLCEVGYATARMWRTRGVLPSPWAVVSGRPLWTRADIEAWRQHRRSGG